MAYATANLVRMAQGAGGGAPSLWTYVSDDLHTDVDATDYFADGFDKGMKVNDVVLAIRTTTSPGVTVHRVSAVTTNGAATIGAAILA
jgi:hypothetical protein